MPTSRWFTFWLLLASFKKFKSSGHLFSGTSMRAMADITRAIAWRTRALLRETYQQFGPFHAPIYIYLLFLAQNYLQQLCTNCRAGSFVHLEPELGDTLAKLDSRELANLKVRRGADNLDHGWNARGRRVDLGIQGRSSLYTRSTFKVHKVQAIYKKRYLSNGLRVLGTCQLWKQILYKFLWFAWASRLIEALAT